MPTPVSIIICTADRPLPLAETLESLSKLEVPDDLSVELIVVDNRPQSIKTVVENMPPSQLSVKYVEETGRGLSHARNAGLASAGGDIIIFTDDDLRFPADWVQKLIAPITNGEADGIAGRIEIAPHLHRPWFELIHRVFLAEFLAPWPGVNRMTGANMAVHRRVLKEVPGFDPKLGAGSELGAMEEGLFSDQITAAGYKIIFNGDAPVVHHFDANRFQRNRLIRAAKESGQSQGYVAYHWEHRLIIGATLHKFRKRLQLAVRRLRNGKIDGETEGCDSGELYDVMAEAFYSQYAIEQKKRVKYNRPNQLKRKIDSPKALLRVLKGSLSKGSD